MKEATSCFRLPPGVDFQRWAGDGDWVLYHSGTGETMRISDLAMAILDLIAQHDTMDRQEIIRKLTRLFDDPPGEEDLRGAVDEHLRLLLSHECIEPVACA